MAVNKLKLILNLFVLFSILEVGIYFYVTKLLKLHDIELIISLTILPVVFIVYIVLILTNLIPEKLIHDSYKM